MQLVSLRPALSNPAVRQLFHGIEDLPIYLFTMASASSGAVVAGDELVSSVTLYRDRHWILHLHIGPYAAVAYTTWFYIWATVFGIGMGGEDLLTLNCFNG